MCALNVFEVGCVCVYSQCALIDCHCYCVVDNHSSGAETWCDLV